MVEIETAADETVGITQWVLFHDEKAFQHLIAYSTERGLVPPAVQERGRGLGLGLGLVLPPVQITPQRRPETMEPPTLTPRHQRVGTNLNLSIRSTYTITSS